MLPPLGRAPVEALINVAPRAANIVARREVLACAGQYDDLDGPAHRILYDDDKDMIPDDAKQPKQDANSAEEPGDSHKY